MADEQQLRISQMEADIENKRADTAYKQGLLRYEPWKLVLTGLGAGAGLTLALLALLSYMHSTH